MIVYMAAPNGYGPLTPKSQLR